MAYVYRTLSRVIPYSLKKKLIRIMEYSAVRINPETFIGFVTATSFLFALAVGFLLAAWLAKPFWMFFLGALALANTGVYLWLVLMIDRKARLIEESLPDALQLMASNLRAGMTPEKALLMSSRPEFGPLKDEIDFVGKKVALGKNVGAAMMDMSKRVRSKRLLRAVELINSGLDSGGSLATLLEATSSDLQDQFLIDKKIKASITMYVIFIFSAAGMIAPILFGLSSFLVEVLRTSFAGIDIPQQAMANFPLEIPEVTIDQGFLMAFILSFLIMNTLMASGLLGLISKGKQRAGLSYFIPMVLLAIPSFLLSRYLIKAALGGLFEF